MRTNPKVIAVAEQIRAWKLAVRVRAAKVPVIVWAYHRRAGIAFFALVIVATWSVYRVQQDNSHIKALVNHSNQLARQVKTDEAKLEAEIARRRKERQAQLNAVEKDLRQSCTSRHALSTVVAAILQQGITNAKNNPIEQLPGLSEETKAALKRQQDAAILQTQGYIRRVKKVGDCKKLAAPVTIPKAAAKPK